MKKDNLLYVFASQREYSYVNNNLMTVGAVGAETGENFRKIFPNMILVGRLGKNNQAKQKVSVKESHLMELDLKSPKILLNFFLVSYRIFKLLKKVDFVIVRAGGLGTLVGLISIMMRKPTGVEVGGCVFNSLWNYGNILGKIFAYPSYFLRCFLLFKADKVQMVTQEYLQKRYIFKSKIKNCVGISNVAIENKPKYFLEERIRKAFNNKIILGSIGSFSGTFKGHEKAVETCKILIDRGFDAELRILGAGDKTALRKEIEERNLHHAVKLYDPVKPGSEVEDWLSKIDIYCQFSRREGVSRALIEAMNLSIPIVATDAGGTYELVDKRSIFPVDNCNKASEIIQQLVKDKIFFNEMCTYSFYKAREFEKTKLDKKRNDFWYDFGRVTKK